MLVRESRYFGGLPLAIAGSRATNAPRQTRHPPKRRPIQPKPSVLDSFHLMGLHFGGHTTTNRGHAAANRGELRHARVRHAGDTPTERFAWRKTPTGHRSGGRWREWRPGGLGRGAGGGDGGSEGAWPRHISHVISDGHFLRPPKNVAIPTR